LERVLADDVLSRENLNSFIYSGAAMLKALEVNGYDAAGIFAAGSCAPLKNH
jgi:hypothetical protein